MSSSVKKEDHDEAEIQELAANIMEANRAKMQAPARPPVPPNTVQIASVGGPHASNQNLGDEESARGQFGWIMLEKNHIPYIIRGEEKYCAVRMVELKALNKYLTFLHEDIYNSTFVCSYYITEAEGRLLDEINSTHCDYQFGREQFTPKDLIVRLSDAIEFYNFLDVCYSKLLKGGTNPIDRCGFIRINRESVVPYTVYNGRKYFPLFYFEEETEHLISKADRLEGWDLSYLKFCCKVQGIQHELLAQDSCAVISLDDMKSYFPPSTRFEDYWPRKIANSQLLISGKTRTQAGKWTRQPEPAGPPLASAHPPLARKRVTQAKAATKKPIQNVQAMYSSYGLTGGQPAYSALQPRTSMSTVRRTYPSAASTSRQTRPSYYTSKAQAPPPLIRASQPKILSSILKKPSSEFVPDPDTPPDTSLSFRIADVYSLAETESASNCPNTATRSEDHGEARGSLSDFEVRPFLNFGHLEKSEAAEISDTPESPDPDTADNRKSAIRSPDAEVPRPTYETSACTVDEEEILRSPGSSWDTPLDVSLTEGENPSPNNSWSTEAAPPSEVKSLTSAESSEISLDKNLADLPKEDVVVILSESSESSCETDPAI